MIGIKLFLWNSFFSRLPGFSLRHFLFRVLIGNSIHSSSAIHRGLEVLTFSGIFVGKNSVVNKDVTLDGRAGITIGNQVSISAGVMILTGSHDVDSREFLFTGKPVVIADYVWIGTRAMILPGVTLSEGSVVAAGSIVTKDTLPYSVVAGNPAVHKRFRSQELAYNPVWKPMLQ